MSDCRKYWIFDVLEDLVVTLKLNKLEESAIALQNAKQLIASEIQLRNSTETNLALLRTQQT